MKAFYVCLLLIASAAAAGESGYILNGKAVILYRNGEKVSTSDVAASDNTKSSRKPSAKSPAVNASYLMFEDDDSAEVRCFGWGEYDAGIGYKVKAGGSIHCSKYNPGKKNN